MSHKYIRVLCRYLYIILYSRVAGESDFFLGRRNIYIYIKKNNVRKKIVENQKNRQFWQKSSFLDDSRQVGRYRRKSRVRVVFRCDYNMTKSSSGIGSKSVCQNLVAAMICCCVGTDPDDGGMAKVPPGPLCKSAVKSACVHTSC